MNKQKTTSICGNRRDEKGLTLGEVERTHYIKYYKEKSTKKHQYGPNVIGFVHLYY